MYSTTVVEVLLRKWRYRMVYVLTNGKLWSLYANKVFILSFFSFHGNPIISLVSLVLVTLYEVPAESEVLSDIVHGWADQTHRNVMPGHAAVLELVEFI